MAFDELDRTTRYIRDAKARALQVLNEASPKLTALEKALITSNQPDFQTDEQTTEPSHGPTTGLLASVVHYKGKKRASCFFGALHMQTSRACVDPNNADQQWPDQAPLN